MAALFALDPDDRAAVAEIHTGNVVERVWITRKSGVGPTTWTLEPYPKRDLTPRKHCLELFEKIQDDPLLASAVYRDTVKLLSSSEDTLTHESISTLRKLGEALRNTPLNMGRDDSAELSRAQRTRDARWIEAATALIDLARIEEQPNPWRQVVDVLANRIPEVALFNAPERELQSSYRIDEVAASPPPALRNLCSLAELDLEEVKTAAADGEAGRVERLFEVANAKLREKFRDTWRQSTVYPRLGTAADQVLRIFIATEDGEYTFPEERSDGLRWFIALHAFLGARRHRDLILLVDEAETHLHYDAQADLIDTLMNQRIARQVIYTTHSVGCLPPDLGCGIRVLLVNGDTERSRIANSYWSITPTDDEKVGYTPLLFGMGARLLALTIPRFGVITEGPSDAILMPSLLREATGLNTLPYRVAPGLAEIAGSDSSGLSRHGGKVVALADGDHAGQAIRKKLTEAGISSSSIFDLGQVREGCTLEDLVNATVLAEAINQEMETWGIGSFRVEPANLPLVSRWTWLTQKAADTGTPVGRLSKPRVAQRVVDIGRSHRGSDSACPLVNTNDISNLRELHRNICAELGVQPGS